MSDFELTTLSTALWLVATVALFILLAGWSTGESWGLTASLVQGVRSWADRDRRAVPITSPFRESLRPILDPYAFVRRSTATATAADPLVDRPTDVDVTQTVEVIDLWERHLRR